MRISFKSAPALQGILYHAGAHNLAWLVGDRAVRLLTTLAVGSWVARHLGEHQYGTFAYAVACVAVVAAASALGMDALVVRDVIKSPTNASRLIGTATVFRMAATVAAGLPMLGLVYVLRPDEPLVLGLVAMLGVGVFFQSLETAELWFQARIQMRLLVLPRLALFFIVNAIKVWLVVSNGSLVAFVALSTVELAVGGILTFALVQWGSNGPGKLQFDWAEGWRLLRECWSLALSGLVVIVYMKVGQLLISGLLDDAALGVYSAAIRVSETANFLPVILASSLLPSLLRARDAGPEVYRVARMRFFRLNALLAFAICVPLTVLSPLITRVLYGTQFSGSAAVLAVHSWSLVFVFMGVARGQHLLNERQMLWSLLSTIWGLAANVVFSLLLIPRYGPKGAAYAVLLAYAIAAVGSPFLFTATRQLGRELVVAILTPWKAFTSPARGV
jgi:polysaccharide transporter, PST family